MFPRITLDLQECPGETRMCAVIGTTQNAFLLFPMERRTGRVCKVICCRPEMFCNVTQDSF